jgi:hypothetical protein
MKEHWNACQLAHNNKNNFFTFIHMQQTYVKMLWLFWIYISDTVSVKGEQAFI